MSRTGSIRQYPRMVDLVFSDARLAALYDTLYPRPPSFDFYLPMILASRAVLDVGCGTGALLHEARRTGHSGRLCGLDPAPGMLEQARRRSDIEWIRGEIAAARWVGEFDLVVMTGHAFQVLVTDEELRAALTAIRAALSSEGRFAFDTRNPAARVWEKWSTANAVEVTGEHGERVRFALKIEAPFDGRTVGISETFTSDSWDRPRVSRSTLRFVAAGALAPFLDEAGFLIEAQFGDFDHRALSAASPEIITIACAR
ncbi:MAG: class I SAM-dependent methyltransferase [Steroidobacteraceae bacterium]|jgi:SAM-dependent methyltransferase